MGACDNTTGALKDMTLLSTNPPPLANSTQRINSIPKSLPAQATHITKVTTASRTASEQKFQSP